MHGAERIKKRAYDILYHFDNLKTKISNIRVKEEHKKLSLSILANQTIYVASLLNKKDIKEYIKNLEKRKIHQYLLDDTIVRKIKVLIAKYNLNFYIKYRFMRKK